MARWARHFVVLVLLMFSAGCITVQSPLALRNPFSRTPQVPAEPPPKHHAEKERETENMSEERGPFVASIGAGEKPELPQISPTSGLKHDPGTRMLIEEELRDATPEERAEWIAFLGTVETAEVAGLLNERRVSMRRENELSAEHAGGEEILPAAHSLSGDVTEQGAEASTEQARSLMEGPAPTEGAESPAGDTASMGAPWQKKFRSFADPNRFWNHQSTESAEPAEHSAATAAPAAKADRPGRPVNRSRRHEPTPEVSRVAEPASSPLPVVTPQQTAALETRITPGSALWEDEMAKLISLLEAEASSSASQNSLDRRDIRKQVGLRMLYLIANEPQKSFLAIPGIPPEEQEFWTSLFLGLSEHLDESGSSDPAARATLTIAQLRSAAYHLQQSANLRLRNLAFCQQINGFGNYETFGADQFSAGQTVLIYAEIRNFKSVPVEESFYLTRIRSTIEIYSTANGQVLVDRSTYDPTEDRSRTLRTDYYHSYRIDLPANLAPGPHLVKLILQDELTGKQATESIPFVVK